MECPVFRGILRYRGIHAQARLLKINDFKAGNAIAGSAHMSDVRLYHRDRLQSTSRFQDLKLLSSPALCASRPFALQPPRTRTLIISKVIDLCREADLTSIEGVSKFILESAPVTAVGNFYQWTEALTGLPWGLNILLCSFSLQLLFNVPANVYLVLLPIYAIQKTILFSWTCDDNSFALAGEMDDWQRKTHGWYAGNKVISFTCTKPGKFCDGKFVYFHLSFNDCPQILTWHLCTAM